MTEKDFIENMTVAEFGIMGFAGYRKVRLEKTADEITVKREGIGFYALGEEPEFSTLTPEEYRRFAAKLFTDCGIMKYRGEYSDDSCILDGTSWSVHIEFAGRRAKNSGGYMMYPDSWDKLMEAIRMIDRGFAG